MRDATYSSVVVILLALLAGATVGVVGCRLWWVHFSREVRADLPAADQLVGQQRAGARELGAIEALTTAVAVLDSSDEVVLANHAARASGVVTDGRLTVELRALARQARRDGRQRQGEVPLPAGPARPPAIGAAQLLPSSDGDVLVLVDDMTDARRIESVRRDFVANVSHELKTPVAALSLLAEALVEGRDDPAAVDRFARRLQHEAQRLGRLIQDIIELSRLQGADPRPAHGKVALDHLIVEAVDRMRVTTEMKRITLVRGGESGLTVDGDETQLVTVLVNLLDNAIVYSRAGGRVSVGIRRCDDAVEISVTDEGIGISEADLNRIFERFYRVDPARSRETGGTGLGLAIVKHIVGQHGGSIRVWSAPGKGSTFTVLLPLVSIDAPEIAAREPVGR